MHTAYIITLWIMQILGYFVTEKGHLVLMHCWKANRNLKKCKTPCAFLSTTLNSCLFIHVQNLTLQMVAFTFPYVISLSEVKDQNIL